MTSPFPGMDPYLEDPVEWIGTHNKLVGYMEVALNAALPLPYAAYTEARCYVERREGTILPDVAVQKRFPSVPLAGSTSALIAERSDPALHFQFYVEEQREYFIEIRDVKRGSRVVTAIELLSPLNKNTRGRGQQLYKRKQQDLLISSTHFIEIDLLRGGKHTTAIPLSALRPQHHYDYHVCLHRAEAGGEFDVWLSTVRERLPRIAVPLEGDIPAVTLDLQAVLDRCYDEGAYIRKIDYTQAPIPPLEEEDAAWADALLKEKGLR